MSYIIIYQAVIYGDQTEHTRLVLEHNSSVRHSTNSDARICNSLSLTRDQTDIMQEFVTDFAWWCFQRLQSQVHFMKEAAEGCPLTLDEVWPWWWCPGVHGWRGPSRGWGSVLAWGRSHAGWGSSWRGSSVAGWGSARAAGASGMHGPLHVSWGRGCASWSRSCHHQTVK